MAKNTTKNDALSMFNNTKPVKIQPKVVEETIQPKPDTKIETETPKPKVVQEEPQEIAAVQKLKKESTSNKTTASPVSDNDAPLGFSLTMNKKAKNMKSRTFYLDDALYNKLAKLAKSNGSSTSEYLSFILEQILK